MLPNDVVSWSLPPPPDPFRPQRVLPQREGGFRVKFRLFQTPKIPFISHDGRGSQVIKEGAKLKAASEIISQFNF